MVEYVPATDETRVRFPADAFFLKNKIKTKHYLILFYYFIFNFVRSFVRSFVHLTLFDFGSIFSSIPFDDDDKIPFVNHQNIIINRLINFIKNKQFYLFYNTSLFFVDFFGVEKRKKQKKHYSRAGNRTPGSWVRVRNVTTTPHGKERLLTIFSHYPITKGQGLREDRTPDLLLTRQAQ